MRHSLLLSARHAPCPITIRHQRRIDKGDQKAGTAVDPTVFLGVEERLEGLGQGGGGGGVNANYRPYSDDNPDSASVSVTLFSPASFFYYSGSFM